MARPPRRLAATLRAENPTDTLIEAGVSAMGVLDDAPRTLTVGLRLTDW